MGVSEKLAWREDVICRRDKANDLAKYLYDLYTVEWSAVAHMCAGHAGKCA
jgi:hypothetical protein